MDHEEHFGKTGKNLIFLLSQPRAGSTLLQRILGSHPDVHTLAEPWIMLHPLYALKQTGLSAEYDAALARQGLADFLAHIPNGEEAYYRGVREMASVLYGSALAGTGRKYFLDKTPRYYAIIPELFRTFPHARFVMLLRNPLAVLFSTLDTWFAGDFEQLRESSHYRDLTEGPRCIAAGLDLLGDAAITVRYEELVCGPDRVMQAVCGSLALPYCPSMLDYGDHPAPAGRFGDRVTIHRHSRPADQYRQRWLCRLASGRNAQLADEYLRSLGRDLLDRLGYSFDEIHADIEAHAAARGCRPDAAAPEAMLAAIKPLVESQRYAEAVALLEELVRVHPRYAPAFTDLGFLSSAAGDKDRALEAFRTAAALDPGNPACRRHLADHYLAEMGQLDAALLLYTELYAADPQDVETVIMIGNVLALQRQFDRARQMYERALTIAPAHAGAMQNLATLQQQAACR